MNKKYFHNCFLLILIFFIFVSCASVAHYDYIDGAVREGNYDEALSHLQESKKTAYKEKDKVLYYLEEGMIAHYAGDYALSSKSLNEAERGIEAAVTKSISLETSTYLVNDSVQEYPGDDYEDLYLNVFNALNYWQMGSVEGALVEVRRFDNKIKFLSTKYGTVISNSQKSVLEKNNEIPYDPDESLINFSNSALGQYLGMLFYRSEGYFDDARINRNQLKIAFANHPHLYKFPLPASIDEELEIPQGMARLNILSFVGPSPIKTEETMRIFLGDSKWLKIALPVITPRPSVIHSVEVAIESGPIFTVELIEDLAEIAQETFKQKIAFIYFKTVLRSLAKTNTSIVLDKAANEGGGMALSLLSIGTQIYAEASEQADLRMSRYFPAKAYVGGITLEPGSYTIVVSYKNHSGHVVHTEKINNIEVKANKLNLVEAVCIQ